MRHQLDFDPSLSEIIFKNKLNPKLCKGPRACYPRAVFHNVFLPRLGQPFQYLEAPLDAKIGLEVNESDNWRPPPRLRTTALEVVKGYADFRFEPDPDEFFSGKKFQERKHCRPGKLDNSRAG